MSADAFFVENNELQQNSIMWHLRADKLSAEEQKGTFLIQFCVYQLPGGST